MELLEHEQVEALSAVVFTLGFAGQLARVVMGWSMQLGPYDVPMYMSYIAIVVAGYLTYEFWRKVFNNYDVL